MSNANATELFVAMHRDIEDNAFQRTATDASSPATTSLWEAQLGRTYELRYPEYNLVTYRPAMPAWANANVLHFFAGTDEAEMLERYNKLAPRFLVDGKWFRSYGTVFMPQIRACIGLLSRYPQTRRAIAVSDTVFHQDINCPQCMSSMQFLTDRDGALNLLVYQRSLNLHGVMPYDVILLTNILGFVAKTVHMPVGSLRWTIGSLHTKELGLAPSAGSRQDGIILPYEVLASPDACLAKLRDGI